ASTPRRGSASRASAPGGGASSAVPRPKSSEGSAGGDEPGRGRPLRHAGAHAAKRGVAALDPSSTSSSTASAAGRARAGRADVRAPLAPADALAARAAGEDLAGAVHAGMRQLLAAYSPQATLESHRSSAATARLSAADLASSIPPSGPPTS